MKMICTGYDSDSDICRFVGCEHKGVHDYQSPCDISYYCSTSKRNVICMKSINYKDEINKILEIGDQ